MTTPAAIDSWTAYRKPRPQARLRLFCFPYAGGGALLYRTWADGLPADVEVCPIQLPGRGTRLLEPLFTQFSPLI
ncbi:MAG: putative thioesterase, partial [Deltaproteobacteria bacterium]|nr:putative thioesterase [Deltaproteobacteria bacterium]